ncbi:hypothetical protein OH76DRAFT_1066695 [Lentinus brumalis]|uniref:Uncharacterized protein n=1 Tax=Lentinus brumalis TaxID=2498619 RepID=A0A371DNL8_9APHY|nr:hypothetical protein OH76DRAFT_1066695 [Polyporus brumalis]
MSSVAAMHRISSGDEDLAQLYHQVLAGFAEESPTSEQPVHVASPPADRELESIYGQYQDGEGTPTANRQPSARSATTSSRYGLPPSPRPPPPPPPPAPQSSPSNPQSPSQRAPRPLPRIPGSSSASLVPPPPPPPMMYGMPEARPYPQEDLRQRHTSIESGRQLPRTPNGYNGVVNPPANSAMLGRLPSLNGGYHPEPRPSSAGARPGSSDSLSRSQYTMPVPDTSDSYGWRPSTGSSETRRPPPGAQPSKIPGYNGLNEEERPPSSPSTLDMPDAYNPRGEYSEYRPYSQQSSSSFSAAPQLPHSHSCRYSCFLPALASQNISAIV